MDITDKIIPDTTIDVNLSQLISKKLVFAI